MKLEISTFSPLPSTLADFRVLPLDGFLFDLHGAMNVQGLDDAERDLATDLRRLVGPRCLISASMDLHGNVSPDFVRRAAIFASITDSAAVEDCSRAGAGQTVELSLGGKLDPRLDPLRLRATVQALHPTDPVGGDLAVVKAGGVNVILTSRRKPFHVIGEFTRLGLDPAAHKVTAVTIGYLEPELRAAARLALLALTPGAANQDIPSLPYRRVRRPMFPLDDAMSIDTYELAVFQQ